MDKNFWSGCNKPSNLVCENYTQNTSIIFTRTSQVFSKLYKIKKLKTTCNNIELAAKIRRYAFEYIENLDQ